MAVPEPAVRRHVWVSGRVQGVGYRASCAHRAKRAGVAGWALNLADGRVEAVFEGEPRSVEDLLAWCRTGPRHARVTGVVVREEPAVGETGFSVR